MKPGIQEQGAKCRNCEERPGMLTRILGNLQRILEMISFKILGNVEEDSRECSRRFRGMLVNILCIAQEDSGECSILDSWEYSRRLDAL